MRDSLKDVGVHRVLLSHVKLQETQQASRRSSSERVDEASSESQRTDQPTAARRDQHPLPQPVLVSSFELGVEELGSVDDGDLVVNDSSVSGVNFVKLSQLETGGCFDEVGFRGLGVLISEGGDDNVGEVDELSVDFKDSSGGVELRFDSVEREEREVRTSSSSREREREEQKRGFTGERELQRP